MSCILVVDDDKPLRMLFGKRLEHAGYKVLYAGNGEEALAIARDQNPDIILLDYHMPVMGGDEMLVHLRQSSWGKQIKVILMSAASSIKQAVINEADSMLYKPITGRELHQAIKEVL